MDKLGDDLFDVLNKAIEVNFFVLFAEVLVETHLSGSFLPDFYISAYRLPLAETHLEHGFDS
jgi:hypothetical protein